MQPRPATAAAIPGPTPVVTAVLQLRDGQIEAARATLRGVLAQDANQPDALILLSSVTLCSGEVEAAT
jgi:Tfp pilus assembly protein PilF